MKRILLTLSIASCAFLAKAQTPYIVRDSLANNPVFLARIKNAALEAANSKIDTADAPKVIKYAQMVITDASGMSWLASMSYGALTNPVINYSSTDSDLLFAVIQVFNKLSFAYYRDIPDEE